MAHLAQSAVINREPAQSDADYTERIDGCIAQLVTWYERHIGKSKQYFAANSIIVGHDKPFDLTVYDDEGHVVILSEYLSIDSQKICVFIHDDHD